MKLGSLFDGIGGWCLAAQRNGITPVWSSEIETFPLEVTKRRFPNVKQLGDVTKIDGSKIEPVDIITSGSPCQNLSVAGDRKGLCGSESRLFYDAIRIVHEMRVSSGGVYPRYYIFENVPGTLTSNEGMDFRIILESITDTKIPIPRSGRWATAGMVRSRLCDVGWRCLDAQFFNVAQRRNRLWIICDFAETDRNIPEILFERKSLQGNLEEEQGTWQGVAPTTETSSGDSGRVIPFDTTQITSNKNYSNPQPGDPCHPICAGGHPPAIAYGEDLPSWDEQIKNPICLRMRAGKEGGGKGALLSVDKSMSLRALNDQVMFEIHHTDDLIRYPSGDKANCLQARMGTGGNQVPLVYSIGHDERSARLVPNQADPLMADDWKQPPVVFSSSGNYGGFEKTDTASTLRAKGGDIGGGSENLLLDNEDRQTNWDGTDLSPTLTVHNAGGCQRMPDKGNFNAVISNHTIRRLTPIETERLQGLPDNWTLIDHKSCTDSARYKALGNGMSQPVPDWLLRRLVECSKK